MWLSIQQKLSLASDSQVSYGVWDILRMDLQLCIKDVLYWEVERFLKGAMVNG
jgi:uncharacterized membrane protein